jgi:hypothetical protein
MSRTGLGGACLEAESLTLRRDDVAGAEAISTLLNMRTILDLVFSTGHLPLDVFVCSLGGWTDFHLPPLCGV